MHRNFKQFNRKLALVIAVVLVALAGGVAGAVAGQLPSPPAPNHLHSSPLVATGSGFTYQGRLIDGGNPANGQYDLVFTLYDAATGGNTVGAQVTQLNQAVSAGLFTVVLDYGPAAFVGEARWLEIAVRPAGVGNYTTLTPRQPLTPSPYALSAPWLGTSGKPTGYNPQRLANTLHVPLSNAATAAVTIGADGFPLIAFVSGSMNIMHCTDLACATFAQTVLDSGQSYDSPSITIGSDGLGLVTYRLTISDLAIAHCANVACTGSDVVSYVELGNAYAGATSVTIGTDGFPLISYAYHAGSTIALKVAHCNNVLCTNPVLTVIDSNGANYIEGRYSSVAIGADGLPLISYESGVSGAVGLKVAHCGNLGCTAGNSISVVDAGHSMSFTSLAVGADGLGTVGYYDATAGQVKLAHCNVLACTSATVTVVGAATAGDTALVTGADGFALLTYNSGSGVYAVHCGNTSCTTFSVSLIDIFASVGQSMSSALGIDGLPLAIYLDTSNFNLRVAHCGSPQCISYQHRR